MQRLAPIKLFVTRQRSIQWVGRGAPGLFTSRITPPHRWCNHGNLTAANVHCRGSVEVILSLGDVAASATTDTMCWMWFSVLMDWGSHQWRYSTTPHSLLSHCLIISLNYEMFSSFHRFHAAWLSAGRSVWRPSAGGGALEWTERSRRRDLRLGPWILMGSLGLTRVWEHCWHTQSFPLNVTLSPMGKGLLRRGAHTHK